MTPPSVRLLQPSSISPAARDWVQGGRAVRILHVFTRSCNLIDAQDRILSLVSEAIGDGPFNAVLPGADCDFQARVDHASPVAASAGRLRLGALEIDFRFAPVWNPRLDWAALHASRAFIRQRLLKWIDTTACPARTFGSGPGEKPDAWQEGFDRAALGAARTLSGALNDADLSRVSGAAECLAGLGEGLTPAGDDILMGAIYAAWILHGTQGGPYLAGAIVDAARSRTTSLSLAWLCAAARGEAAIRWHRFLTSLLQQDRRAFESSVSAILATGHTSGAAALYGFAAVILPELTRALRTEWVRPDSCAPVTLGGLLLSSD